ncbi:MAG: YihY/virulence factor BrkB family protein [Candidatus Abyssubacteria bacterium]
MEKAKVVQRFLTEDLWRIRLDEQPRRKSLWVKPLRVLVLSIREFDRDKCMFRASALTFYTLLSIVPVLAMAFGIAKGFGFEQILEQRVREQFEGHEEVVVRAIEFARNMLENTQGGLIAGVGLAFLFWTVIKVLGNMERSFNEIWGIKTQRSLMRKFSDYLSFMLIGPVLFIMAGSMTVAVASQVENLLARYQFFRFFAEPVLVLLRVLPFGVLWALFAFVYVFLPNGKVNVRSALLGGILGGTIYQMVQWAYITFQIGINRYNAIYGSFAALPLFLMWLQLSWSILLYGAEISFAHQNIITYEFEQDCLKVSSAFRRLAALAVAHLCVKAFHEGTPPLGASAISKKLGTPIRLVNQCIYDLVQSGVLSEVTSDNDRESGYQPALDIDRLTLLEVMERLENTGVNSIPLVKSEAVEKMSAALLVFRETLQKSPDNVFLKDL